VSGAVVLMYHRLGGGPLLGREPGEDSYAVEPEAFEAQLDGLGGAAVDPEALLAALGAGRRPPSRAVALTFDDGNASDHAHALPALGRRGLRAAFFVTPAWTGTPGYLDRPQLRELAAAGMTVGAHGLDHTPLASLPAPRLLPHLTEARRLLEDAVGGAVTTLSLPGGSGNRRVLDAAREAGFTAVFDSTPRRCLAPGRPIPRFAVRRLDTPADVLALAQQRPGALLRAWLRHRGLLALRGLLGAGLYARLRTARLGSMPAR
jgi:peptidoglycan/xylan/chitin deacetylase (PgdA/CDA1 family)